MDKLLFPYRSPTHLPLLHVIAESGSWEKHGVDVDYDRPISSAESHVAIANGEIEFVGGNHVSTYGHRARGDNWIYLGQTVNSVPGRKLVVSANSGIGGIAGLRKKSVGTRGRHPGLNDWLYLKQHGLDADRDDVEMLNREEIKKKRRAAGITGEEKRSLWQDVRDGICDAAFLWPPATGFARRAGLKVIDIEPMPMIFFTTVSSSLPFVERHPDVVERFLKGMIEGIHYFKTRPEKAKEIIRRRYVDEGQLDDELTAELYQSIAEVLDPKLYPTPQAIANVYLEGIRQDKDAAKINPMELWDLHFIRRLDDAGFASQLYR